MEDALEAIQATEVDARLRAMVATRRPAVTVAERHTVAAVAADRTVVADRTAAAAVDRTVAEAMAAAIGKQNSGRF